MLSSENKHFLEKNMTTTAVTTTTATTTLPAVAPETKNKYEYLCLDLTRAYFTKVVSDESSCLSAIAKVSLLAFPVIAALVALEALFDLFIAAPITFVANCIAGPQEIAAVAGTTLGTGGATGDGSTSTTGTTTTTTSTETVTTTATAPVTTTETTITPSETTTETATITATVPVTTETTVTVAETTTSTEPVTTTATAPVTTETPATAAETTTTTTTTTTSKTDDVESPKVNSGRNYRARNKKQRQQAAKLAGRTQTPKSPVTTSK